MKIAIITDTHFGARNDLEHILDHSESFFKSVFFPYMKKNGIHDCLHLGDIFDKRKTTNTLTINRVNEFFFSNIEKQSIKLTGIIGNHDCYYKTTNSVNTPALLCPQHTFYDEPCFFMLGGQKFLALPWITPENQDKSLDLIKQSGSDTVVLGHLELNGFYMSGKKKCEDGLDRDIFDNAKIVLSGHYHNKQSKQNKFHYLGSPYRLDHGHTSRNGFHVYDTTTGNLTFVENPHKLFETYDYNDLKETTDIGSKYVRVLLHEKPNQKKLDDMIRKLQAQNPYKLEVIEKYQQEETDITAIDIAAKEDTLSTIETYIDDSEIERSDGLKKMFRDLYGTATEITK